METARTPILISLSHSSSPISLKEQEPYPNCETQLLSIPLIESECPLCKTRRNINDIRDREISYTISAEDIRRELGIEIIEEQKVQLSKVNRKCEKCGHEEANFYTRQMRSADEGQTTFYTCTRCGHQFQEN